MQSHTSDSNKKNERLLRLRYSTRKQRLLRIIKKIAVLVLILFLVFRFLIGFSYVSGNSMQPTLNDGDILLYSRIFNNVKIGDIISVAIPSGEYYVKRVVALEGDTVDIIDGKLYINGIPEAQTYVIGQTKSEDGNFTYPFTVSPGHAFVLGDNREASIDSRYFGEVSLSQVKGVIKIKLGFFYVNSL